MHVCCYGAANILVCLGSFVIAIRMTAYHAMYFNNIFVILSVAVKQRQHYDELALSRWLTI